jgi:hypothetical protein
MNPFSRRDFLQTAAAIVAGAGLELPSLASPEAPTATGAKVHELSGLGRLFPEKMDPFEWREFHAAGYPAPVTGIVYRQVQASWSQFGADSGIRPVSGVPMGGIDTGALYVEASGAFGYSSIFNHYTPQGGPLNTPYFRSWALVAKSGCSPAVGPRTTRAIAARAWVRR